MSQFDIVTYLVQVFWVLCILIVAYYFFVKYVVSGLYINLKLRKLIEKSVQRNVLGIVQSITNTMLSCFIFYKTIIEEVELLNLILSVWYELNYFFLFGININVHTSVVFDLFELPLLSTNNVLVFILNEFYYYNEAKQ